MIVTPFCQNLMIIKVNDCRIRIFHGATVGDVLLRYAIRNGVNINLVKSFSVTDRWGHVLDHEAPLSNKQIIKIVNL